jgi:hypothetical protein
MKTKNYLSIIICLYACLFCCNSAFTQTGDYTDIGGIAQYDKLPVYLGDRGPGTPTSMFGTYIRKGELFFYPFFEYYLDDNAEYSPNEFGFALDQDFRGKYRAAEYLIFLGYGLTDRIVIELEAAYIDASQETSPDDPTGIADKIEESGLGDVQTQIDFLWMPETETGPGLFSYLEIVYPHNKDNDLIGTGDWEFKAGTGVIRGFKWGTMTARVAAEYSREEEKFELGELAVEFVKRLSAHWRIYAGVEGNQDEIELIAEVQWHINDNIFFKFNNAFGATSKAADWAPEVGIMFSIL